MFQQTHGSRPDQNGAHDRRAHLSPVLIADSELADLRERLRRTRWPDRETVDDWSQGIPLAYVQEVCRYWADDYDWRRVEAELNAYAQVRYVDPSGLGIQVLHAPSPEPSALPLVLTHGWPGSVVEFLDVVEPLRDPAAHGGDAADAFHVVCPTLPGYGFSDKPTAPGWGVERIADVLGRADGRARPHALRRPGRRLGRRR